MKKSMIGVIAAATILCVGVAPIASHANYRVVKSYDVNHNTYTGSWDTYRNYQYNSVPNSYHYRGYSQNPIGGSWNYVTYQHINYYW